MTNDKTLSDCDNASRANAIRDMFSAIVPRYDFLNRLLRLGIDRGWRRTLTRMALKNDTAAILDVACGTGDVSLALRRQAPAARIIGLDFSQAMLDLALTFLASSSRGRSAHCPVKSVTGRAMMMDSLREVLGEIDRFYCGERVLLVFFIVAEGLLCAQGFQVGVALGHVVIAADFEGRVFQTWGVLEHVIDASDVNDTLAQCDGTKAASIHGSTQRLPVSR